MVLAKSSSVLCLRCQVDEQQRRLMQDWSRAEYLVGGAERLWMDGDECQPFRLVRSFLHLHFLAFSLGYSFLFFSFGLCYSTLPYPIC